MAARRSVVWSRKSKSDLAEIWSYYREVAEPRVADGRVRAIAAACATLEAHPFAGRSREEVRPGLRCVLASPHVIFYRVINDTVQIVRILDGRRDIEEIFSDEIRSD